MKRLELEDLGLLQVLQRIRKSEGDVVPSVRHALVRRGLIEGGERVNLTAAGELFLHALERRERAGEDVENA